MKISVTLTKAAVILEVGHEQVLKVNATRLIASPSTEAMFQQTVEEQVTLLLKAAKARNGKETTP